MTTLYIFLALILAVVIFLPFMFKAVEERLEFFLFLAGLASVSASGIWSLDLVVHTLKSPLAISAAVLISGLLFSRLRARLERWLKRLARRFGDRTLVFGLVAALGLVSGIITALVAALILSEAVVLMELSRKSKIRVLVLACYAIGLGAALTPLGEPLGSIVVSRLRGEPHHADFWFLGRLLGAWVLPLLLLLSAAAMAAVSKGSAGAVEGPLRPGDMLYRAFKVYVFVAALELLGAGFNPATGDLLKSMPAWALYWTSLVSAVLDNASLAAAGLAPGMSAEQLKHFMLGLMISGGMMVPGNFPNIVCAGKLGIGLKEWALFGVPVGLALMAAVFAALRLG